MEILRNKIIDQDLENIVNEKIDWEIFKGKNILITGASGILPSYIVETFLFLNEKYDFNIHVIGLVRNIEKAKKRFSFYLNRNEFTLMVHDVCQPFKYAEKIDYIIHAAGQASPKFYGKDPVGTAEGHVIGTSNILKLAVEKKVQGFLYFSSCAVYGVISQEHITVDETSVGQVNQLNIRSCYAESKRMGENLCMAYHHQYQLPIKIMRIAHTYGPAMPLDDGRVFTDFVSNIVHNENILLNSDGKDERPLMYISDAVRAYFRILVDATAGEVYNVVSPEYTRIIDLAKMLVALYPEKELDVIYGKAKPEGYIRMKDKENHHDISKLLNLGWVPQYSIQEGFSRTLKSYLYNN